MITPANIAKFNMNSNYSMDKIIGTFSGSLTVPSAGAHGTPPGTNSVNQSLSFGIVPLTTGVFSTDQSNWTNMGNQIPVTSDSITGLLFLSASVAAYPDFGLIISANNGNPNQGYTIYYKVVCLAPDTGIVQNYTPNIPINFQSKYPYMLIAVKGSAQIASGGSATIPHNLGYVPNFFTWITSDDNNPGDNLGIQLLSGQTIDSTNLYLTQSTGRTRTIYYRIYYNV